MPHSMCGEGGVLSTFMFLRFANHGLVDSTCVSVSLSLMSTIASFDFGCQIYYYYY